MQICLIDNEPIVLQTLSAFLADLGHSVMCCSSGSDLDELAGGPTANLVIADLQLPGLNGLELVNKVHGIFPETPIVIISGHRAAFLSMRDAIENDVYAFLRKPFSLSELEFLLMRLAREKGGSESSWSPDSTDEQDWENRSDGGGV